MTNWEMYGDERQRFERDADPQQIAARLVNARRGLATLQAHVEWLDQLYNRRVIERADGTWPYPPNPAAAVFPCGKSHVCGMCSPELDVKGPGCIHCRQTGYDQTPCLACAKATRPRQPIGPDLDLLIAAADQIIDTQFGSLSMIQRKGRLSYARAERLMELLEDRDIVGLHDGTRARKVLVPRERKTEILDAIRAEAAAETAVAS